MARVRVRLRHFHCDGQAYVWRAQIHCVRGNGDCHRAIRLRVWGGGGKTSLALQADLLSTAWPGPYGACATDDRYPAPEHVGIVIRHARKHGWDPALRDGTFLLTEREHGAELDLPGFVVTDRLRTPEGEDPTDRVTRAARAAAR